MSLLYPREMLKKLIEEGAVKMAPSSKETIFALVDAVFFASLMVEEGEPVRLAVVYDAEGADGLAQVRDAEPLAWGEGDAPAAWDVTKIAEGAFNPHTLAKLSRGLRYGTQLVVVGGTFPKLRVDGIARRTPRTDGGEVTRIAAPRPGVLVFEEQGRELIRFEAGQHVPPTVDVLGSECPVRAAVAAIAGEAGKQGYSQPEWALLRMLRRMREKGAGAILAMLPSAPDEGTLAMVKYRRVDENVLANRMRTDVERQKEWFMTSVANSEKALDADEVRDAAEKRADRDAAREAFDAAIDDVAELSAIDGAVLVGPGFAVYGAGYLIPSAGEVPVVKSQDAEMKTTEALVQRHGARHKAAFSFAFNNPGGVAFVVSEDGPVSCALRVENRVVVWPVQVSET